MARPEIFNALSVDVEDYYQVEAFSNVVPRSDWHRWESRVTRNTHQLLSLFERHGVRGTFFTLGWVAERQPALVRQIAAAGHELACHGYDHRLIYRQSPGELRADVRRARSALEDIVGEKVYGYRAPSYSITRDSAWALDVLIEEGFRYDSSVFPIHHHRYGWPGAGRTPHLIRRQAGEIIEFPPSTVALGRLNLPLAGGGYFRLLPYPIFRAGLRWINRQEQQPAIFMVHPWEIDAGQPLIPGRRLNVVRHRINLGATLARLDRLLRDFRFAPVRDVLAAGPLGLGGRSELSGIGESARS